MTDFPQLLDNLLTTQIKVISDRAFGLAGFLLAAKEVLDKWPHCLYAYINAIEKC
jgi:hypothetical protein